MPRRVPVLFSHRDAASLRVMPDLPKLKEPSREDLILAIAHSMLYRKGTRRAHDWESINARVAAERLIDGLASSNYVILRKPPSKSQMEADGDRERSKLTE